MFRVRFQQNNLAATKSISGLQYALIISLAIHLIAIIITAIFLVKEKNESEDFIYVDIIQATTSTKFRRAKLRRQENFAPPEDIQFRSQVHGSVSLEEPKIVDRLPSQTDIKLVTDAMILPDINSIALNVSNSGFIGVGGNSIWGAKFTTKTLNNRPLNFSTRADESEKPIILKLHNSSNLMSQIDILPQPDFPLEKIAKHLLRTRQKDKLDIVFIVDASQSMGNNIATVINHLSKMINILQSGKLDFTIGVVTFRHGTFYSMVGWDTRVMPQTTDITKVKRELGSIRCRGDEKALDALMQAAAEVKFRQNAERHFILVTDEYVSGSYSAAEVIDQIQKFDIKVDVIGIDEPFQKMVAQRTGGLWFFIGKIDG